MTDAPHTQPARIVPVWAIVAFLVLALGGAWAVTLPLWLSGRGLSTPGATLFIVGMMFTPLVAAALVLLVLGRRRPRPVLRFLGVWPLRPAKRTVWVTVAAYLGGLLLPVAALAVAVAAGWFPLDLTGFGGFRDVLRAQGLTQLPVPIGVLVTAQLVQLPFLAAFNAFVTIGEEIGWRGFLVPALSRFGTWPALIGSGVVWGLWHTPIILLGYNFGRFDGLGVLFMVVACVLLGTVLGWLRLRTGSVWPAVFAHAGVNGAAGVGTVLAASGVGVSNVLRSPLGYSGWIVLAVVIAVLVLTGAVRRRGELAPARPAASTRPSTQDAQPAPSGSPSVSPSGSPSVSPDVRAGD
ncbi:CPBP family intramembrane glutamic endopeptidase [Curtobacterium sp. VKM Ac-2922]|uniref:CPBP family intramembrane glutamic endopeptidase n=1 Tax=Curtobacterium sp. VKM Ac-2922 TaxID=2929475 RepID=UPI001FB5336F|nr:CPBP family intramembrane glutamic endopeptidase [Curtobacterium sp. VKM Ac-2922]MCJ1713593.1 CPBP family intramembrane metalloprotease [Curtobacterium sp. VKM Ac-2922]